MLLMANLTDQQSIVLLLTAFSMGSCTALYGHLKEYIENKKNK